jgi:hypothetical protein
MPKYWLISDRNNGGVGQGMNAQKAAARRAAEDAVFQKALAGLC